VSRPDFNQKTRKDPTMAQTRNTTGGHDANPDGNRLVENFLEFQRTGQGFNELWPNLHAHVTEMAEYHLRKFGVRVAADDGSVAAVEGETTIRLMSLAAEGAKGRFDPNKAAPGISGFRGWLWKVVRSQTSNWLREEQGGRKRKIIPVSNLEWNEASDSHDDSSILKNQPAKIERADLLPILEEVINELTNPAQRQAVRVQLEGGLSKRQTAKRLNVSISTMNRRLNSAYAILIPLLEQRGVDCSRLTA
jgi:RNA polymerase sigma factor (sigma-70 family)